MAATRTAAFLACCLAFAISCRSSIAFAPKPSRQSSPLCLTRNEPAHFTSKSRRIARRPHPHRVPPLQAAAALSPLAAAAPLLGSVGVLAAIVLIHESGHYLAAKRFNITVEEFSIGFGPKLLGFAVGDTKSGSDNAEEFNLRALPLGGYVRFPENYNATEARIQEEAEYDAAQAYFDSLEEKSIGYKLLNGITLGAIDGKRWSDEKQRRLRLIQAEADASKTKKKQWWNFLKSRKAASAAATLPTGGEIQYYDDPNLLQNRSWQQRAVVLSGGVVFNLLLAFSIYFGQISVGPGLPVPVFGNGVTIAALPYRDAPAAGVLSRGDVIVGVDGEPLMRLSEKQGSAPTVMQATQAVNDVIGKIRAKQDGESVSLSILHNSKPKEVQVQPKRRNPSDPLSIGVELRPYTTETKLLKSSNPLEAADMAFSYASTMTKDTANGLFSLFSGLVSGPGSSSSSGSSSNMNQQVSGPIGLIKTGSQVVATQDWTSVLLFAAAISINLGVINSIPLPALDGGQLVFVLAEAVTGRKVDQRFQEGVTGIAVLLLLLLSAGTFVGDVSAIFGTR